MVILSDLSDVLIRGLWGAEEHLTKKYGDESVGWAFTNRCSAINSTFQELLRGNITEDEYWREFFRVGHYRFDAADAREALRWNLQRIIPGTLDVYKRIRAYPDIIHPNVRSIVVGRPEIIIVSDHIKERTDEVQKFHPDLFKMVQKSIWSCDAGKIKSDDGFFAELLGRECLHPSETIFIDDLVQNIAAASRAGVMGIRFESHMQLETLLKSYGFEFAPKEE